MKQDFKIDHTKGGFDAFGITIQRGKDIADFVHDLMMEAGERRLKRSEVIERIIDFSNTIGEAMLTFGFMEGLKHEAQRPKKDFLEIEVVGGADGLPEDLVNQIKSDISAIKAKFHKGGGKKASLN